MAKLGSFPLLSTAEFQHGCSALCNRLSAGHLQVSLTHEVCVVLLKLLIHSMLKGKKPRGKHGEGFMILKRRLEADVRMRKNTARWLPAEDEQEEEDGDNDDEVCFVLPALA